MKHRIARSRAARAVGSGGYRQFTLLIAKVPAARCSSFFSPRFLLFFLFLESSILNVVHSVRMALRALRRAASCRRACNARTAPFINGILNGIVQLASPRQLLLPSGSLAAANLLLRVFSWQPLDECLHLPLPAPSRKDRKFQKIRPR